MFKIKKSSGWGFLKTLKDEEFRWLTNTQLRELGDFLLRAIQEEADKDRAMLGQLPRSPRLDYSWNVIVEGDTLFLQSDWPWIEMYIEGKEPHPMTWLTQEKGVYKVPLLQRDGTVHIRTAPLTTADAWIHPGIARHTFLNRAFQRMYKRMSGMFVNYLETWEG